MKPMEWRTRAVIVMILWMIALISVPEILMPWSEERFGPTGPVCLLVTVIVIHLSLIVWTYYSMRRRPAVNPDGSSNIRADSSVISAFLGGTVSATLLMVVFPYAKEYHGADTFQTLTVALVFILALIPLIVLLDRLMKRPQGS